MNNIWNLKITLHAQRLNHNPNRSCHRQQKSYSSMTEQGLYMNTPPQNHNYLFNKSNINVVHHSEHFFVQSQDIEIGAIASSN